LKVVDADHTNFRVKDLDASLGFYRDAMGLEPFGLEEYHRGERTIVSLRVTERFILHVTPDPEFERGPTGGYDDLSLVVEEAKPDELAEHLRKSGVEVEKQFESISGACGEGPALYLRDPDGYRVELKFYKGC
jgi:catechol 2,3-dioxygenase-like lactoylglutathione lyase family enzyme